MYHDYSSIMAWMAIRLMIALNKVIIPLESWYSDVWRNPAIFMAKLTYGIVIF